MQKTVNLLLPTVKRYMYNSLKAYSSIKENLLALITRYEFVSVFNFILYSLLLCIYFCYLSIFLLSQEPELSCINMNFEIMHSDMQAEINKSINVF